MRSTQEIIADLEACESYVVFARSTMEAVFRPTPEQHAQMTRRADLFRELLGTDDKMELGVQVLSPYGREKIGTLIVKF